MPKKLDAPIPEGTTIGLKVEFIVRIDDSITTEPIMPNPGVKWSLKDQDGNVINDREGEDLIAGEAMYVVLKDGDTSLDSNYPEERFLTVWGTYSSPWGNNLPLIDEVSFTIENLVGAPAPP